MRFRATIALNGKTPGASRGPYPGLIASRRELTP